METEKICGICKREKAVFQLRKYTEEADKFEKSFKFDYCIECLRKAINGEFKP